MQVLDGLDSPDLWNTLRVTHRLNEWDSTLAENLVVHLNQIPFPEVLHRQMTVG